MKMVVTTGLVAALGVAAALSDMAFDIRPRLLYNPSASAPIGWYRVETATHYEKGERVAAFAPMKARLLADAHGYLPQEYPLIKYIWAKPGDRVCRFEQRVSAPNRPDIYALLQDGSGRDMPVWSGCVRLGKSEYFIASPDHTNGWDSRYFGVIDQENIVGRVRYLGRVPFFGAPEK